MWTKLQKQTWWVGKNKAKTFTTRVKHGSSRKKEEHFRKRIRIKGDEKRVERKRNIWQEEVTLIWGQGKKGKEEKENQKQIFSPKTTAYSSNISWAQSKANKSAFPCLIIYAKKSKLWIIDSFNWKDKVKIILIENKEFD